MPSVKLSPTATYRTAETITSTGCGMLPPCLPPLR